MRILLPVILSALFLIPCAHAQWEIEDTHTTANLRGIDNVGDGVAWASGSNGTILRTKDGGYRWQLCALPPGAEKLDFRGVQAFDAKTAIVMSSGKGDLSRLYKTTDGCQSWKLVFTNPDKEGFWDTMRFYDQSQVPTGPRSVYGAFGVLIGDPMDGLFRIWNTGDKGETWTPWNEDDAKHPPKARKGETLFAASNQAVVVPGSNSAFAFITGGSVSRLCMAEVHNHADLSLPWSQIDCRSIPFPAGKSSGAFAVAEKPFSQFLENFVIMGGDYKKPNQPFPSIYVEEKSTWLFLPQQKLIKSETPPSGFRSAVAYDAQQKLWITVGPNGTDISRDDGRNWRALKPGKNEPSDADKNWNALSLPFVVGPNGRIGKLRPSALQAGK